MDSSFSNRSTAMIALLAAMLAVRAAAQDTVVQKQPPSSQTPGVPGSPATKPTPTVAADTARDPNPGATAPAPSGLKEVLKMVDAGISTDIIRMFIQNSTVACDHSADDIIALKQRGAPDEIAMALLKRSAELKAQASPISAGSPPAGPAPAAVSVTIPNYGGIDPESYAYFYHYYLHPRTLASVYQRLGVYGSAYPNGFYPSNGPFYSPQFGVPPGAAFQPYPRPWR
jgi:hypothetical protein